MAGQQKQYIPWWSKYSPKRKKRKKPEPERKTPLGRFTDWLLRKLT